MTHSQRNPRPGEVWTDPESGRQFECWERGPLPDGYGQHYTNGAMTYWLVTIDPRPYEQPYILAEIRKGRWLNRHVLRKVA